MSNKNKITENTHIIIRGAKIHNLKNIDIDIKRDQLIVITGLSGSGKSSLAFDTIYAEGQRRYVESLSSYARQFLGRIKKPEVEYIKGLPPAIAIEQKVNTRNPRSTVGTSTEIYDYLKLLFALIGITISPISGKIVKKHSIKDVSDYIIAQNQEAKIFIMSKLLIPAGRTVAEHLEVMTKQGYSRVEIKTNTQGEIVKIEDIIDKINAVEGQYELYLMIDRIKPAATEENLNRIADSVQTAFYEGSGSCIIKVTTNSQDNYNLFSNRFEEDGILFEEPTTNTFSFNSPAGACTHCEGFGSVIGIDEDLVVPNKNLSIYEEAIACWHGEKMQLYKDELIANAEKCNFPIHKPYSKLSEQEKKMLWEETEDFTGINKFFEYIETETHKIQYRIMLSKYRGKTACPECRGTRLKKTASFVKINGYSIQDLVLMQIKNLIPTIKNLELNTYQREISKRILIEISNRLEYLYNVGLGYLTLNRLSSTLSGGESQRINLATSLGSNLVGSAYILDEPSIGLHSCDAEKLITVLKQLKALGNTVIVVEHDEEMIQVADEIIDVGPQAGINGGHIVFQGNHDQLLKSDSLTSQYLTGRMQIETPKKRRKPSAERGYLEIIGAKENNLKNISVKFPLGMFIAVTGVSGSGKSSLIKDVLLTALRREFDIYGDKLGRFESFKCDLKKLSSVEFVDQNPIGKSSRSNPVTYIKAYDDIRKLFGLQQASVINNLTASHFSFNIVGGRCEECQGEGVINVEMQFMADVTLLCESCKGRRFKEEILDVKYKDKNIADVLDMSIEEAIPFFEGSSLVEKKIVKKLKILDDVGMGYVCLGQASNTLSGGESQRIKLASFLTNETAALPTLFIFDEPTTGLHFHDIKKLLRAFEALIARGHSLIVIEHNLDVVKSADWIIDMGPEGGENGGHILFAGTPEDIIKCEKSITGKYLKTTQKII